eukprot:649120-Alexandrium_andersonii.AAC.1
MASAPLDEKALAFTMQRQVCMEILMSQQLAAGGAGSEPSGATAALPLVLLDFMADIAGNEALLRPVQSRGVVVLDKGLPLVTTNEEQLQLPPCQQTEMPTPL